MTFNRIEVLIKLRCMNETLSQTHSLENNELLFLFGLKRRIALGFLSDVWQIVLFSLVLNIKATKMF